MKFCNLILALCGLVTIYGCTNTAITPLGNKTFAITTQAQSKEIAYNTVLGKAQAMCGHKKKVYITDNDLTYRGITKEQATLVHTAHNLLPLAKNESDLQSSSHNYRVTLTFYCDQP